MASSPLLALPRAEQVYLLTIRHLLSSSYALHSLFLVGSAGAGSYSPGQSDLDLICVLESSPGSAALRQLMRQLSHESLPCPARKLEFVLYTLDHAREKTPSPQWSVNLNTGRGQEVELASLSPESEEERRNGGHWFLLDLAGARQAGRSCLIGVGEEVSLRSASDGDGDDEREENEFSQVFSKPEDEWVLQALKECVGWYASSITEEAEEETLRDGVLNASRAWKRVATRRWGSKEEGAVWAVAEISKRCSLSGELGRAVTVALALRNAGGGLEKAKDKLKVEDVKAFVDLVVSEIDQGLSLEARTGAGQA